MGANIEKGKYGFFMEVPEGEIRILQLADVQIIDSGQMRRPDRLCEFERLKWRTERVRDNAYAYVEEAVARAKPHLIILTGDNMYGEFDDSGRQLKALAAFLDGFGIPWAPVFGNHDNESAIGPALQCEILESASHSLFMRGSATGNGNYSVTLVRRGVPLRTLLMLDSHGCLTSPGIRDDQIELCRSACAEVVDKYGILPPLFACYHIPSGEFLAAAAEAGYQAEDDYFAKYELGVTLPAKNGDCGKRDDPQGWVGDNSRFMDFFKAGGGDGIFVGHYHNNCTSILSGGIRYTFGLKTGLYDYHSSDMVGSTLITLTGAGRGEFSVRHLYSAIKDEFGS
ncbi:MAG: metallophosphoesterase [Clostridia bacterium]|nr:metallophosphoesterase [Clostridia bacterium]